MQGLPFPKRQDAFNEFLSFTGLDEDNENEFDVIDVSSDEALDEEQNFLFKKIKSKIKQETPDYLDIFEMDTQVRL